MNKGVIKIKSKLFIFALLLLVMFVAAKPADFDDFPDMFYDGFVYVIAAGGDQAIYSLAAIDIGNPIKGELKGELEIKLSSEGLIPNKNIISIGTPCENEVTKKIMGLDGCEVTLKENMVFARLFDYNNNVHMVLFGNDASDVREAAKLFSNYRDYNLNGNELCIDVTNLKIVSEQCLSITTSAVSEFTEKQDDETVKQTKKKSMFVKVVCT